MSQRETTKQCVQATKGSISLTCWCLETQCLSTLSTRMVAAVLITDSRFFIGRTSNAPVTWIKQHSEESISVQLTYGSHVTQGVNQVKAFKLPGNIMYCHHQYHLPHQLLCLAPGQLEIFIPLTACFVKMYKCDDHKMMRPQRKQQLLFATADSFSLGH